jgi:hypothetical protein
MVIIIILIIIINTIVLMHLSMLERFFRQSERPLLRTSDCFNVGTNREDGVNSVKVTPTFPVVFL